jgi:hypothetical protein
LWSWNNSFEVSVFAAFDYAFMTFDGALGATLLLLLLFLSSDTFSLALIHAFYLQVWDATSKRTRTVPRSKSITRSGASANGAPDLAMRASK